MDQANNDVAFVQSMHAAPNTSIINFGQPPANPPMPSHRPQSRASQRIEAELKDTNVSRKLQKADREKLRRDRLNEHFLELGNTLDPDRPKNDKATILSDTIHLLKDLTSQVNKLNSEYSTLTEESRELTQEKNDLKEEKASLKSDIDNLNIRYQQTVRVMFPWSGMDHSVVMAPPSYPFPMPMTMPPPGSIPMHPSMQPYPYFGTQAPTTFVPYMTSNTLVEQQSTQHVSQPIQPCSTSHISSKQDSRNKSSGESKAEKKSESNDVTTDLELKTPGLTAEQDPSLEPRRTKKLARKENGLPERSSSSRCSSSHSAQDSSSNSIVGGRRADDLEGGKD